MWAVLTWSDTWEANEFFETGRQEIADVIAHVSRLAVKMDRNRALDFGCGLGRLSQALADHFDEVYGVDIAPSMIEGASLYNRHGDRCRYILNSNNDLPMFPDRHFDFIYSNIVLQHMAPKFTRAYLAEFIRLLSAHGLLVFQLPSALNVSRGIKARILNKLPESVVLMYRNTKYDLRNMHHHEHRMEMNGIEKDKLIAFIHANGGRVIDVRPDKRITADDYWDHYQYTVIPEWSDTIHASAMPH
jgi:SAM-dependent methyltransferase